MEQWPVKPVHHSNPIPPISLTSANLPSQFTPTALTRGIKLASNDILALAVPSSNTPSARLFQIPRPRPLNLSFIFSVFSCIGGAVLSANLCDRENGFPALEDGGFTLWSWVAEACRGEGAFGPAVVDAGEMPVYVVRGSVPVELIADVDEVLD